MPPNQSLQTDRGPFCGSESLSLARAAAAERVVRHRRFWPVEVVMLDALDGNVIARGSYFGGPDYEFIVSADGQVYFRVVGDKDMVWAGPDADSFRRIAAAWNRYQEEKGTA